MTFAELCYLANDTDRTTFINAVHAYIAPLSIRYDILYAIINAKTEYGHFSEEYKRGAIIGIIMQMYFNEYKEYPL